MDEATEAASRDIRRHYREIYRYVRRRSRSDADAEDLTQDVFADAARALGTPESGEGPPVTWLYTVARRRLIDRARRQARRKEVFGDTALELVTEPPSEYGPEVSDALRSGIERLPQLQRDGVLLKLVRGRSFAEIASALDATEGACRMRFQLTVEFPSPYVSITYAPTALTDQGKTYPDALDQYQAEIAQTRNPADYQIVSLSGATPALIGTTKTGNLLEFRLGTLSIWIWAPNNNGVPTTVDAAALKALGQSIIDRAGNQ